MADSALEVARDLGLPPTWLNDGVKVWLSASGDFVAEGLPQFSNLHVLRPVAEYLLAMKCLAARTAGYDGSGDKADVITLLRHLGMKVAETVMNLVCQYYRESRISPRTRYFIEEAFQELGGSA